MPNPDIITIQGKQLSWKSSDSRAFGYIDNKFVIGIDELDNHFILVMIHKGIDYNIDDPDLSEQDYQKKLFTLRKHFQFPGRLWINNKIITFWEYPNNAALVKIISELKKININIDSTWQIQIKQNNRFTLINVDSYAGSQPLSEYERSTLHVMLPKEKSDLLKRLGTKTKSKTAKEHFYGTIGD